MIVFRLALRSLRNRWITALLTVCGIAVSVMLLLGVEKVRDGARTSFTDTISGTDVVVGARTGDLQLLLYTVFRMGSPTNNITWESYRKIADRPEIAWIVPLSLGDSHRGYPVMGTSTDYFTHYRYRGNQHLAFATGKPFEDLFDAVLGADVAARLGYGLGDKLVVAHGLGAEGFARHDDKPFRVSGILARTGTPVDRTVHISLEGYEAMHADWQAGAPIPGLSISADELRRMELTPNAVTAALVGLKSRLSIFSFQRYVNTFPEEPLLAVLPGVALYQLWDIVGTAERALGIVSAMVVATALLGMVTAILSTLNERRREMAILRSVGAHPRTIFGLLVAEAGVLTAVGLALGTVLLYAALFLARPAIDAAYGIHLPIDSPSARELATLAAIALAGLAAGAVPALRAYRLSLADGMTVRT